MNSDFFKGLGSATQGGAGNYVASGEYLTEVVSAVGTTSKDPKKKGARLVIIELRVVETLVSLPAGDGYAASNRPGEICSVVCNLDSLYPSMDLGRLKGFLGAVLGDDAASDDDGWAAVAAKVLAPPGHALAGQRVVVSATRKTTQARKQIVATTFRAAPE